MAHFDGLIWPPLITFVLVRAGATPGGRRGGRDQHEPVGKSPDSRKTGNQEPWDVIEKLVTEQMWAKIFCSEFFLLIIGASLALQVNERIVVSGFRCFAFIYPDVGAVVTVGNSTFLVEFSKRCGNGGKTHFVFPGFP